MYKILWSHPEVKLSKNYQGQTVQSVIYNV